MAVITSEKIPGESQTRNDIVLLATGLDTAENGSLRGILARGGTRMSTQTIEALPANIPFDRLVMESQFDSSNNAKSFPLDEIVPLFRVYDPNSQEVMRVGNRDVITFDGFLVVAHSVEQTAKLIEESAKPR